MNAQKELAAELPALPREFIVQTAIPVGLNSGWSRATQIRPPDVSAQDAVNSSILATKLSVKGALARYSASQIDAALLIGSAKERKSLLSILLGSCD